MTRSARLVLVVLVVQLSVLTIGITDDYRLKHEDNNALHATFARSHLRLGFETTKAQNYFYTPAAESGTFYANHPPGPGVVLAAVYRLTGHDGPTVTRATAIMLHMLSTVLFLGFACRVSRDQWDASFATLVFVLLPESAFFGRMMNHEVLVLPAGILLVWSYWESVHATERAPGWQAVSVVACVWAALAGWAGFFVIAACILHAAWEAVFRQNARGRKSLVLLIGLGGLLFLADVAHLAWVQEESLTHLRDLFASRIGLDADYGAAWRIGRILEVHWRYFSLTGMVALAVLAYRGIRDMRLGATTDPLTDVGLIFFCRRRELHYRLQSQRCAARLLAVSAAARECDRDNHGSAVPPYDSPEISPTGVSGPADTRVCRGHHHGGLYPVPAAHEDRGLLSRNCRGFASRCALVW